MMDMYGGKDMKSSVDSHKRPFAQTFHCILILLLLVVTFIKSPHRHMRLVYALFCHSSIAKAT